MSSGPTLYRVGGELTLNTKNALAELEKFKRTVKDFGPQQPFSISQKPPSGATSMGPGGLAVPRSLGLGISTLELNRAIENMRRSLPEIFQNDPRGVIDEGLASQGQRIARRGKPQGVVQPFGTPSLAGLGMKTPMSFLAGFEDVEKLLGPQKALVTANTKAAQAAEDLAKAWRDHENFLRQSSKTQASLGSFFPPPLRGDNAALSALALRGTKPLRSGGLEGQFAVDPSAINEAIRGERARKHREFFPGMLPNLPGGGGNVPPSDDSRNMFQQFGFALSSAGKELTGFRKSANDTSFALTKTAEVGLSLSSILRPISPGLSNVFMSAAFSSFSTTMGPLPAILTAATSAVAGVAIGFAAWTKTIQTWISSVKEAGFETETWYHATLNFNTELKTLIYHLGLFSMDAFGPVLDSMARFIEGIDKEALDSLIQSTALFLQSMIELGSGVLPLINTQLKLLATTAKAFNLVMLPGFGGVKSLFGGPERSAVGPTIGGGFKSSFSSVEDLGRQIQASAASRISQSQLETLRAIERNTAKLVEEKFGLSEFLEGGGLAGMAYRGLS